MSLNPRILAFCGSVRNQSWNRKLLVLAVNGVRAEGAEVTLIDLCDFPMPIYDGDLESERGSPGSAVVLREAISNHDGLMIASPEHNGSITALLKNSLDWSSRSAGRQDVSIFRGKPVALLSASPSPFGGLRGIGHTRAIFTKMGARVLTDDVCVPFAGDAFDEAGKLKDPAAQALVGALCRSLINITGS